MNYCGNPAGVNFNYECYTRGNPLLYQVWGYGNTSPSTFEFQFYKNDNFNPGSDFWGGFSNTGNDAITIAGYRIVDNDVHTLALRSIVYCSGDTKTSIFGWYDLDNIGKPDYVLSGQTSMTVDQVRSTVFSYFASGYTGSTITWEIQPSGYQNFSANGQFNSSANGDQVLIQWNPTPGIATIKVTSSSPCATVIQYLRITINQ